MKRLSAIVTCSLLLFCIITGCSNIPVYEGGSVFATVAPISFWQITDADSDYQYILAGTVSRKEQREGKKKTNDYVQKFCYNIVTVQVEEVIKGVVGDSFCYYEDGGKAKSGWTYSVDYVTEVNVGDEVLIFAKSENESLTYEQILRIENGCVRAQYEDVPEDYLTSVGSDLETIDYRSEICVPKDVYYELLRKEIERDNKTDELAATLSSISAPGVEYHLESVQEPDKKECLVIKVFFSITAPEELPEWVRICYRVEQINDEGKYEIARLCNGSNSWLGIVDTFSDNELTTQSYRITAIVGKIESEPVEITVVFEPK